MDKHLGSETNTSPTSIDKSKVLDVKPLRALLPIFPSKPGSPTGSDPQPPPFSAVPPSGSFPPGVQPFYPIFDGNDAQKTAPSSIPAPVPLNSFPSNGASFRRKRSYRGPVTVEDESDSQRGSGFSSQANDAEDVSTSGKRRSKPKKRFSENGVEFDVEPVVNSFLTSFKLKEINEFTRSRDDKDIVQTILLVYDLIRRQLTQLEEAKHIIGVTKRPDLKSGSTLTAKGIRANSTKRIGLIPGIEVGDIFFFRMELCIVGLHAPSMAGIDYMTVKITSDEEPLAVSIVSSGGYEDEVDDGDVLIYSGQGGMKDGQMFDQKLERGNLALEKSLHRGNEIRVIRGLKDASTLAGKIYVYDGLYKIQKSWSEKNKSGCNVFKYKLARVPGQPEAFSLWKLIQQWKDGTAARGGVILPDLTSGAENQPVSLVNDVDDEKGPDHFTYTPNLKYTKPFSTSKPSLGCRCTGGCQPGDTNCACTNKNDGLVPYSTLGVLLTDKYLIHECGQICACPPNCRNRMSQAGLKVRMEVFKTKNRGWGLRSWDPIRTGGFICEYAGDVIDASTLDGRDDDNYIFDATRYYKPLESVYGDSDHSVSSSSKSAPYPLVISSKNNGNVARFMNHSCSPNVFWQPVLRESNSDSYLHIAFFALRHIPPMQELTFDYGIVPPESEDKGKKKCLCGSVKCRGYFY